MITEHFATKSERHFHTFNNPKVLNSLNK